MSFIYFSLLLLSYDTRTTTKARCDPRPLIDTCQVLVRAINVSNCPIQASRATNEGCQETRDEARPGIVTIYDLWSAEVRRMMIDSPYLLRVWPLFMNYLYLFDLCSVYCPSVLFFTLYYIYKKNTTFLFCLKSALKYYQEGSNKKV